MMRVRSRIMSGSPKVTNMSYSRITGGTMRWLALVVLLLASHTNVLAQDPPAGDKPERVIQEFYSWYLQQLVAEKDPFEESRAKVEQYVSARLVGEIDSIRKSEDGLDADPFLAAQDFDDAWAKNITVTKPEVKGERATADVLLKGEEFSQNLRVALVLEKGAWKLDKVEGK